MSCSPCAAKAAALAAAKKTGEPLPIRVQNLEDCPYTKEFLTQLLSVVEGKIVNIIKSQINVYDTNCELFYAKINEYLTQASLEGSDPSKVLDGVEPISDQGLPT